MSPAAFRLFTLLFITLFQNLILLMITLPALTALENRGAPFGALDAVATALFLVFLVGETIADQQQWAFHRRKKAELAAGREPDRRFLTTGLFRYSRHPNFFFEQTQWWSIALFGVAAAGALPWTVAGALLLSALFVGSTMFTEGITRSKYPDYAGYQATTSAVVPWFPRARTRR
jgi:steroid 5-alpha reductase family enzyme